MGLSDILKYLCCGRGGNRVLSEGSSFVRDPVNSQHAIFYGEYNGEKIPSKYKKVTFYNSKNIKIISNDTIEEVSAPCATYISIISCEKLKAITALKAEEISLSGSDNVGRLDVEDLQTLHIIDALLHASDASRVDFLNKYADKLTNNVNWGDCNVFIDNLLYKEIRSNLEGPMVIAVGTEWENVTMRSLEGADVKLFGQSVLNPTEIRLQIEGNASQINFHPHVGEKGGVSQNRTQSRGAIQGRTY